jgi:hypothetical protein
VLIFNYGSSSDTPPNVIWKSVLKKRRDFKG